MMYGDTTPQGDNHKKRVTRHQGHLVTHNPLSTKKKGDDASHVTAPSP